MGYLRLFVLFPDVFVDPQFLQVKKLLQEAIRYTQNQKRDSNLQTDLKDDG